MAPGHLKIRQVRLVQPEVAALYAVHGTRAGVLFYLDGIVHNKGDTRRTHHEPAEEAVCDA